MLRGGEVTEVRPNYSVSRISWPENYSESREPTQLGIIMSGCDGKSIKVFGIIHLAGSPFVPEQLASTATCERTLVHEMEPQAKCQWNGRAFTILLCGGCKAI